MPLWSSIIITIGMAQTQTKSPASDSVLSYTHTGGASRSVLAILASVMGPRELPSDAVALAPAWIEARRRFAEAMEPLLSVHLAYCTGAAEGREGPFMDDVCSVVFRETSDPHAARRAVSRFDSIAATADDPAAFFSAVTLARVIESAACEAADVAVDGIEADLAEQSVALQACRKRDAAAEDTVHAAVSAIRAPAVDGRASPLAVNVALQALRAALRRPDHRVADSATLAERFAQLLAETAAAFGPATPMGFAEVTSEANAVLEGLADYVGSEKAISAMDTYDLGSPFTDRSPPASPLLGRRKRKILGCRVPANKRRH